MSVLMVQSKFKPESVAHIQAAVDKVIAALDSAQPEAIRYASLLQPDGETMVALLQVDDGVENPLSSLPEYQELLEMVEPCRAEPPVVQRWTLTGTYRLF